MSETVLKVSPCYWTQGIAQLIQDWEESTDGLEFIADCLLRHSIGDWGDVCPEDAALNTAALSNGERVVSAYKLPDDGLRAVRGESKIWIITEADRSATTVLLPSEY